jgi:hypothetical protein
LDDVPGGGANPISRYTEDVKAGAFKIGVAEAGTVVVAAA